MDPVALFLLSLAAIFLIGAIGEIIFQRTNIPDVIWLIIAGILLGPVFGLVTRPMLESIAPFFAAITLVVVLFEGGSRLKLQELSHAAPRSSLLGLLAFLLSVVVVGAISMLAAWVGLLPKDTWTWTHGWLLGAILGGSSSIIIMPAMAQAKLAPKLANLVNLESAMTDAFCVVGTAAIIDILLTGATGAAGPAVTLLKSFGIGLAIGAVAGLIWILFLRFLRSNEHAYPVTLSALLILYVVIDRADGSAALGILTVAIILGNAKGISTKIGLAEPVELDTEVRGFHRQMAFIIKSFFFVFIGAMLGSPWSLVLLGVLLGAVLLAARVPSVLLATLGSDFNRNEKEMIGVSMPRGMAAGVLATLPMSQGVPGTQELPVLVFACVFTTILVFAVGFPIVKGRMKAAQPAEAAPPAPTDSTAQPAEPAPLPAQPEGPPTTPQQLSGDAVLSQPQTLDPGAATTPANVRVAQPQAPAAPLLAEPDNTLPTIPAATSPQTGLPAVPHPTDTETDD